MLPRTNGVTPLLVVADVRRAADFYVRVLGYQQATFFGEPPSFCLLNREGFELMLSHRRPWDVYLRVADIDVERQAIEAAGGALRAGPRVTEYGMTEIEVEDPDGHVVCLAQEMEPRGGG
jgi:predicted enzyme related to lactoylglutathione lyase